METETDAIARAAPSWSLADDKRLLDCLQKMHDSLLAKCDETNDQLTATCNALTEAALALDNVNNRFMSLSNSQFVERRVYDDDADVTASADDVTSQKIPEQPTDTAESAAENMKRALKALERMHEPVVILAESDSDSGSDGDGDVDRVVFKLKDVYSHRPLPHIIGTKAWKSKWHAGLLPDDSASESEDTDGSRHFDRYSDNERYSPESDVKQDLQPVIRDQMSTSSSDVTSERDASTPMSPADVAAELARRLGQPPKQMPQPVMEECPPQQVPRKLYKPENPPPGTIFPDEPPPIDASSSDHEDDIFAELRKNKPYTHSDRAQSSVAKDLFGVRGTDDIDAGSEEDGDIFSDLVPGVNKAAPTPTAKHGATSTESTKKITEPSSPIASAGKSENEQVSNKKPVGGISVFGGGQHSAIGAAILQRQRQAAFSDDTDGSDVITSPKQTAYKQECKENTVDVKEKAQKDIFDDLFAKSDKVNAKRKVVKDSVVKESVVEKKVDLFSDNLFDDIDDIFSSNVVIPKLPIKEITKNSGKSLFDDEDDLFRDIAVTNTSAKQDKSISENETVAIGKTASIFDSDDDLFSDKPLKKIENNTNSLINNEREDKAIKVESINDNNIEQHKDTVSNTIKSTKSIFDSDDDLFVEFKPNSKKVMEVTKDKKTTETNDSKNIFADSDDDIFSSMKTTKSKEINTKKLKEEVSAKSNIKPSANDYKDKSIFEDADDLFKDTSSKTKTEQMNTVDKELFREDRDLFKTSSKTNKQNVPSSDEKCSKEIKEKPKLLEDKSQITARKSVEDILQSDAGDNKESESTKTPDNTDVWNVSEPLKLDTENIEEKETQPTKRKESIQDEVSGNAHVTVNSEVTKRLNVQLKDDEDKFKSVMARQKEGPIVTTHNIKPEISRKPTSNTDTKEIFSKQSQENIPNSTEKVDNLIFKDDVDNMKVIDTNKNITSAETNDTPNTTPSDSKLSTPTIFSEILNDQPPIFEKPKEPKRSKNINALFDDDSDDEALFYRKSDAVLDDVPSVDKKDSLSDDRFQLFLDEPPAIDSSVQQNTDVKNNEYLVEPRSLSYDTSITKSDAGFVETSQSLKKIFNDNHSKSIKNVSKLTSNVFDDRQSKDTEASLSDDELFLPSSKSSEEQSYKTPKENQEQIKVAKKVGKLKPMKLNINVNSLLPGAVPKKAVKIQEQTDGHAISAEDVHSNATFDSKEIQPSLVKSVSFDGDPDSGILDNKLSKERAKIKVKRRPSSRRARHEAARKSGIDFGQDSTDNSSSTNDFLKGTDVISTSITTENQEDNMDSITCDSLAEDSLFENREEILKNVNVTNENLNTSLDLMTKTTEKILNNDKIMDESLRKLESPPQQTPSKDVKSKVVYILSDEDIFNDAKAKMSSEASNNYKPKIFNIVDDDNDDIFKSITPSTKIETPEAPSIKTLGNVYKAQTEDSDDDIFKDKQSVKNVSLVNETMQDFAKRKVRAEEVKPKQQEDKTKSKVSIFDDLSDEENELFNKKEKATLPEKKLDKKKLFDSDSDSDLFSGKRKKGIGDNEAVVKKEIKRVEVKESLFGDDDDEDLFGAHSKKSDDPLSALLKPK